MALLSVVLVCLVAAVVSGFQLHRLWESQNNSIERFVPALVYSQQLQSQLLRFQAQSAGFRSFNSEDDINLNAIAMEQLAHKMQTTLKSSMQLTASQKFLDQLTDALVQLARFPSAIAPISKSLVSLKLALDHKQLALAELHTKVRQLVEPHILEAGIQLNQALASDSRYLLVEKKDYLNRIVSLVKVQKTLSELLIRISGHIDVVEQLSKNRSADGSAESKIHLRYDIRSITQVLATLDESPTRRSLATELRELRNLTLGEGGVISILTLYNEQQSVLEMAYFSEVVVAENVSSWIDSIVAQAQIDNVNSSEKIQRALYRVALIVLLGGCLVLAVVAVVNRYIVERQINNRMTTLTSAVLEIADGNTEKTVGVTGNDELGRMAESLEIFKKNARELHRSNHELEQFAYAASHDLRSPLRAIENLAQWTLEDAGDNLPPDCKNHLLKLLGRVKRLSSLQDDLLTYARAGHADSSIEFFNATELIKELSELLDSQNNFKFSVLSDVKPVKTFLTPLRHILLNLISNAINHHDLGHGRIEVVVKHHESRIWITVTDDGPGIASKYHSKIFELFQTLQSQDVVEGSGLGLPLIVRLVERYAGTVTVSSKPEESRGTTFEFDWPIID
jgi:signal transduction histidine kinase